MSDNRTPLRNRADVLSGALLQDTRNGGRGLWGMLLGHRRSVLSISIKGICGRCGQLNGRCAGMLEADTREGSEDGFSGLGGRISDGVLGRRYHGGSSVRRCGRTAGCGMLAGAATAAKAS